MILCLIVLLIIHGACENITHVYPKETERSGSVSNICYAQCHARCIDDNASICLLTANFVSSICCS